MHRLWLTQMYLYQFYIPDLICLANDVEENPWPTVLKIDPNKTEDGLKRKLDIKNQSNVVKKSKFIEINTSVNAVKNARFIYDNILANENCWSNVNTFLFVPCNAKEQSLCCSLLNTVVKPCSVSRIPQQQGKPTKLYKTQGDGNCVFRAISYSVARRQVPNGENYSLYCKYQLLEYKPWDMCQNNVWNSTEPNADLDIKAWHVFLCSPSVQVQVPNWEQKLQNVIQNVELETDSDHSNFEENKIQEEWMILSDFHNSSANFCDTITGFDNSLQYWQLQSDNYSEQQISEMPLCINAQKDSFQEHKQLFQDVDIDLFSDEQRLAYDVITTHSNKVNPKEPLWLIINGVAGTGKRYLIDGVYNYLKNKCIVTATTGKASHNINEVTIHSLLTL